MGGAKAHQKTWHNSPQQGERPMRLRITGRLMGRLKAAPPFVCCVLIMSAHSSPSEPFDSAQGKPAKPALTYPATTMGTVVEDYHGTTVADPYRWMENLDSPEVAAWIKAENAVTDPYLASLPHRKAL